MRFAPFGISGMTSKDIFKEQVCKMQAKSAVHNVERMHISYCDMHLLFLRSLRPSSGDTSRLGSGIFQIPRGNANHSMFGRQSARRPARLLSIMVQTALRFVVCACPGGQQRVLFTAPHAHFNAGCISCEETGSGCSTLPSCPLC